MKWLFWPVPTLTYPLCNALDFTGSRLKGNCARINPLTLFSPNDEFSSHVWATDSPEKSAWEEKWSGSMFVQIPTTSVQISSYSCPFFIYVITSQIQLTMPQPSCYSPLCSYSTFPSVPTAWKQVLIGITTENCTASGAPFSAKTKKMLSWYHIVLSQKLFLLKYFQSLMCTPFLCCMLAKHELCQLATHFRARSAH